MLLVLFQATDHREQGSIRMNDKFCKIDGEVVSTDDLEIIKAKEFANAVKAATYAHFIECKRTDSNSEIIVFNAEVQIGQKTVNDKRKLSRK